MFEGSGKWKWILAVLILANLGGYLYRNWGLVTVRVTDAPLGQVISSIEWQSWMKIYTNLPLDSKVSMYVDHVPLAEAMETLAANVEVPPPADGDDNGRPRRDPPPGGANQPGGPNGGGSRAGGGRGGFGRVAQWNLAFFVAPSSREVAQEIREFTSNDPGGDSTVYAYGTQMQLVATENSSVADPRGQAWPGFIPDVQVPPPAKPDPPAPPGTATPTATVDAASGTPGFATYLQAFAAAANVWIMTPTDWKPEVDQAPSANSSIVRAVKNFISGLHGSVTEALVLRNGRGGARGDFGGGDVGWESRMRNAINGLPPDERPEALDQLQQEVAFRANLKNAPPEQRRDLMMEHMMEKLIYGQRLSRMSPAKRAQAYARMVTARENARAPR